MGGSDSLAQLLSDAKSSAQKEPLVLTCLCIFTSDMYSVFLSILKGFVRKGETAMRLKVTKNVSCGQSLQVYKTWDISG